MTAQPSLPPDTLVLDGRFRVLSHLGVGGMGEVYLAEQVSLGRKVALKVLRQDVSLQPGMSERFRREAQLLSSVDHPAVVRVIDFGQSESATCLVMDLAEGETLEQVLQRGALPVDRAVALLSQLAEGLAAIHARGIIHRDLKAENVVLTRGVRGEQARLLDFGIARLLEPDTAQAKVSVVGVVLGTPEYMSPEQALGAPLDARSDLYAFGVLGYRMLSGAFPFEGPSPREFLAQHIGMAPTPLIARAPHLMASSELVTLVMRCLEKDPRQRPQSAHHVAELLETLRPKRVLTPPPSLAVPASPTGGTSLFGAVGGLTDAAHAKTENLGGMRLLPWVRRFGEGAAARRHRGMLLGGLALLVLLPAVFLLKRATVSDQARRRLAAGDSAGALRLLDAAVEDGAPARPERVRTRAAVLHARKEHAKELEALDALGGQGGTERDALVLSGVAEDFGVNEAGPARHVLDALPQGPLVERLEPWAEEDTSERGWGALRYLDATGQLDKARLGAAYARWLASRDCRVRGLAAERLGALKAKDAVAALQRLTRDRRRRGVFADCGQGAAQQALRSIQAPDGR